MDRLPALAIAQPALWILLIVRAVDGDSRLSIPSTQNEAERAQGNPVASPWLAPEAPPLAPETASLVSKTKRNTFSSCELA